MTVELKKHQPSTESEMLVRGVRRFKIAEFPGSGRARVACVFSVRGLHGSAWTRIGRQSGANPEAPEGVASAEESAPVVSIGDVSRRVRTPTSWSSTGDAALSRIPVGYLDEDISKLGAVEVRHLKWMLQKDALQQDIFLIGPPSPFPRWLALSFAELTRQEVEFVQLTRDTTEADLKQRREIADGHVKFVDQPPVRAWSLSPAPKKNWKSAWKLSLCRGAEESCEL